MLKLLVVGLGGFLGAIARFGLVKLVQPYFSDFPGGILVVNVLGSLLIGITMAFLGYYNNHFTYLHPFFVIGLLGSFTTMATFAFDTIQLLTLKSAVLALANAMLTFVLCLSGVYFGQRIINSFFY